MIVQNVNSGMKAGYSVSGTELTLDVPEIGSLTVDLQERQRNSKRSLDYSLDRSYSRIVEGTGPWYIATVVIPATEKELVDTGETDEDGETIYEENTLPLDMSKVELHLWGLPSSVSEKIEKAEEEESEE